MNVYGKGQADFSLAKLKQRYLFFSLCIDVNIVNKRMHGRLKIGCNS